MKFRMVDRILACEEGRIETRKTVSFEEYSLLKVWGRKGALPETLLLQVAVESASLLLSSQSQRRQLGVLEWVEELRFHSETQPGSVLRCEVRMEADAFIFSLEDQRGPVASGRLGLQSLPLSEYFRPENFDLQWEALYAAS